MLDKIAKLIDVKSLVTLSMTGGFVLLTAVGEISGEQFMTIYTTVIAFYFGVQSMKEKK